MRTPDEVAAMLWLKELGWGIRHELRLRQAYTQAKSAVTFDLLLPTAALAVRCARGID